MKEILIFWLSFSTMILVAGLAHFVIVRSAREESKYRNKIKIPRGWLHDVERRDWSGEEEGVVNMPPRLPPRVPPEAHVRD